MIFLVGHHASGKTVVSEILRKEHDILHIETSSVVKDYKTHTAPDENIDLWITRLEEEHGTQYFDSLILEYINQAIKTADHYYSEILITGNRMLSGVQYLIKNLKLYRQRHIILAIQVRDEILWERYRNRNREPGDLEMNFVDFRTKLNKEKQRGLSELFARADHVFNNNSNLESFQYEIGAYMQSIIAPSEKEVCLDNNKPFRIELR